MFVCFSERMHDNGLDARASSSHAGGCGAGVREMESERGEKERVREL